MTRSVFIGDLRISTFLMLVAFAILTNIRQDPKPLWAAAAWLTGFETAYQITALVLGQRPPATSPLLAVPGLVIVPLTMRRYRIRASLPLITLIAAIWVAWITSGFHANQHDMASFDPVAEVFNEVVKTAWALAYFWPLLQTRPRAWNSSWRIRIRPASSTQVCARHPSSSSGGTD